MDGSEARFSLLCNNRHHLAARSRDIRRDGFDSRLRSAGNKCLQSDRLLSWAPSPRSGAAPITIAVFILQRCRASRPAGPRASARAARRYAAVAREQRSTPTSGGNGKADRVHWPSISGGRSSTSSTQACWCVLQPLVASSAALFKQQCQLFGIAEARSLATGIQVLLPKGVTISEPEGAASPRATSSV
jgi:hypothetical protein